MLVLSSPQLTCSLQARGYSACIGPFSWPAPCQLQRLRQCSRPKPNIAIHCARTMLYMQTRMESRLHRVAEIWLGKQDGNFIRVHCIATDHAALLPRVPTV